MAGSAIVAFAMMTGAMTISSGLLGASSNQPGETPAASATSASLPATGVETASAIAGASPDSPDSGVNLSPLPIEHCIAPCGPKNLNNITFQVIGVPSKNYQGYPVYVSVNLAGFDVSDFAMVPVSTGYTFTEAPDGNNIFYGSFNTQECDIANPNNGCLVDENYINYNNVPSFFLYPGLNDSPYYYNPSSGGWDFIPGCSGSPYGSIYLGLGDSTEITLQYNGCSGYNGDNLQSGEVGELSMGANNTTGAWGHLNASFDNYSEMNLSEDDSVVGPGGTGCSTCVVVEHDVFGVSANDTFARAGGGFGLGFHLWLTPGSYSWSVRLAGFATKPSSGAFSLTPGQKLTITGTVERTYPVAFDESGLPTATSWNVTLGTATAPAAQGTWTSLVLALPNGSYDFSAASRGYTFGTSSSTFAVDGAPVLVPAPFTGAGTYGVAVDASGLPTGTLWRVSFSSSTIGERSVEGTRGTGSTLATLALANGSYTISASAGSWYGAAPGPTDVTVSGASQTISFTFSALRTIPLTFKEKGLPTGSTWGVSVGLPAHGATSTAASIMLDVTEALYNSTICTGNATVSVPQGYALEKTAAKCGHLGKSVALTFGAVAELTLEEVGLAKGTVWRLALTPAGGAPPVLSPPATSASFLVLYLPAEKYSWAVSTWPMYKATPDHGSLRLTPVGLTETFKFKLVTEKVVFREKGLPRGDTWSVNVTGPMDVNMTPKGARAVFLLENGSYKFTVWGSGGYLATPGSGTWVVVAGPHATKTWTVVFAE
jgi:hypothetical protein